MTAEKTLQIETVNQACDISEENEAPQDDYFRCIFENAPVGLYMTDYSGIKVFLDELQAKGVQDLRTHFKEQPDALTKCYEAIGDVTVNKALLALYKAKSLKQLCSQMYQTVLTDDSHRGFIDLLVDLTQGATRYSSETIDRTLKGEPFRAMVTWVVAAGYENTWERVIISLIPLNENS